MKVELAIASAFLLALPPARSANRRVLASGEPRMDVGSSDPNRLNMRWSSLTTPTQQGSIHLSRNEGAQLLAVGGDWVVFRLASDEEIEIWGTPEGRQIAPFPAGTSDTLGIAPDVKTLATCESLAAQKAEDGVVIWNVAPLRKTSQVRAKLTHTPRQLKVDAAKTLVVCDDNGDCVILRRPRAGIGSWLRWHEPGRPKRRDFDRAVDEIGLSLRGLGEVR
jgi:hypothetical protein